MGPSLPKDDDDARPTEMAGNTQENWDECKDVCQNQFQRKKLGRYRRQRTTLKFYITGTYPKYRKSRNPGKVELRVTSDHGKEVPKVKSEVYHSETKRIKQKDNDPTNLEYLFGTYQMWTHSTGKN